MYLSHTYSVDHLLSSYTSLMFSPSSSRPLCNNGLAPCDRRRQYISSCNYLHYSLGDICMYTCFDSGSGHLDTYGASAYPLNSTVLTISHWIKPTRRAALLSIQIGNIFIFINWSFNSIMEIYPVAVLGITFRAAAFNTGVSIFVIPTIRWNGLYHLGREGGRKGGRERQRQWWREGGKERDTGKKEGWMVKERQNVPLWTPSWMLYTANFVMKKFNISTLNWAHCAWSLQLATPAMKRIVERVKVQPISLALLVVAT